MSFLNTKKYILDACGLISIGFFSLAYALYPRDFAELHIQFSFLDFPIFVGEVLIVLCLGFFFLKRDWRVKRSHAWILLYFAFVIIKAVSGYFQMGPLALRNAALFYYPVFIILAVSFYRRDFFNDTKALVLSIIMIGLLRTPGFNDYWLFTFFSLSFILGLSCSSKFLKYSIIFLLILLSPYKLFFATSRMMIVANITAGFYLAICLYYLVSIKQSIKLVVVLVGMMFMACMFFIFSDHNALKAIFRVDKIVQTFIERNKEFSDIQYEYAHASEDAILRKRIESYENMPVRVYNPEYSKADPTLFEQWEQEELKARKVLASYVKNQAAKGLGEDLVNKNVSMQTENSIRRDSAVAMATPQMDQPEASGSIDIPLSDLSGMPSLPMDNVIAKGESEIFLKSQPEKVNAPLIDQGLEKTNIEHSYRQIEIAYGNAVFRLFIWRDMINELWKAKPLFGFSFGKPLRSKTLEITRWGEGDWLRDGWIGAHNSFLHVVYRAGIVGVLAIAWVLLTLFKMIKKSLATKSLIGVLLCGIIINWFMAANFLLILELPYTAIPIWSIFGLTFAYVSQLTPVKQEIGR